MANVNAPFGFTPLRRQDGAAWTANQMPRAIASGDSTPIYRGDPVTSLATGYITRSTAGTTTIGGVFVGCKYLSTALQRVIWSQYWPGSGATGDVEAYIVNDPSVVFEVQAGGTAIGFADIGSNVQFNLGTGNAQTGLSGAYVESPANTATLPFRVFALGQGVGNGYDSTAAYNRVQVIFNNMDFKTTTGLA